MPGRSSGENFLKAGDQSIRFVTSESKLPVAKTVLRASILHTEHEESGSMISLCYEQRLSGKPEFTLEERNSLFVTG
jgi:hypothetical protein